MKLTSEVPKGLEDTRFRGNSVMSGPRGWEEMLGGEVLGQDRAWVTTHRRAQAQGVRQRDTVRWTECRGELYTQTPCLGVHSRGERQQTPSSAGLGDHEDPAQGLEV